MVGSGRKRMRVTRYIWPPVQCPACVESGREYHRPEVVKTRGLERYQRCTHPECGEHFKSYQEKPRD